MENYIEFIIQVTIAIIFTVISGEDIDFMYQIILMLTLLNTIIIKNKMGDK